MPDASVALGLEHSDQPGFPSCISPSRVCYSVIPCLSWCPGQKIEGTSSGGCILSVSLSPLVAWNSTAPLVGVV